MRVFVSGASGVIGARLIPRLVEHGHDVVGTFTSSPEKAARIRDLGAEAVQLDLLDSDAVRRAVRDSAPDAIIHEATALAGGGFSRSLDKTFAKTNRLRTTGTDGLLAAARDAGVQRFVAQSFAPYRYARVGGMVKTEDDPLDSSLLASTRETFDAMTHVDTAVTAAGGIALRYGGFYGDASDQLPGAVRKGMFPIVGGGGGYMSFVHLDDAASATVLALEHGQAGIYNIVDDEPAPLSDWLPALAEAVGARHPRRLPVWLARLVAGESGVRTATEARGADNAKAKRELGWTLRYPSWRQGFVAAYAAPAPTLKPRVAP
ncbi:NAD-dependent epimerase/dehydratase family protein [Diaminobutyricibacter sp. McL0608]|uniref:NAD-dependent epimerase/dehydratase family protein n=1 Tax=Leifsonia sp. McL0608 TaxID=3143537 RepID=UPI0031F3053B